MNRKGLAEVAVIVYLILFLLAGIGYIKNVVDLCKCDFKAPYKAEVIRIAGVFTPISIVTGYLRIDDN